MSECYDCGEVFDGFGNCAACGSENVGIIDSDFEDNEVMDDDEFEEY